MNQNLQITMQTEKQKKRINAQKILGFDRFERI